MQGKCESLSLHFKSCTFQDIRGPYIRFFNLHLEEHMILLVQLFPGYKPKDITTNMDMIYKVYQKQCLDNHNLIEYLGSKPNDNNASVSSLQHMIQTCNKSLGFLILIFMMSVQDFIVLDLVTVTC